MLDSLFAYLDNIRPLSPELRDRLSKDLEIIEVSKKELLLRDGDRADYHDRRYLTPVDLSGLLSGT